MRSVLGSSLYLPKPIYSVLNIFVVVFFNFFKSLNPFISAMEIIQEFTPIHELGLLKDLNPLSSGSKL